MSTLYLIRHGQASFGKENYDRLSERGRRQSSLLGEMLASGGVKFDALYSGTLDRHAGTEEEVRAAYARKGISLPEATRMEELNEYDSRSILETLIPELLKEDESYHADAAKLFTDRKAFQRVFEAAMLKWSSRNYSADGLVHWADFVGGVYRGIETIMKKDGRGRKLAVITSGGPVSVAVRKALDLSDENTMRVTWQIKNSSVTRFKCTEDTIMLESFNEVSHLEGAGEEGLITYR